MDLSQWPDCKLWVDPRVVRSGAHGTAIPDQMGKQPDGLLKTPFNTEAAINANFYATAGAWNFTGNHAGTEAEFIEWDDPTPTLFPQGKSYALMLDIHPTNNAGATQVIFEIGSPLNTQEGVGFWTDASSGNLRLRGRENDGANVANDSYNSQPLLNQRRSKMIVYRSKEQYFRFIGYWTNGTCRVDGKMELPEQEAIGSIDEIIHATAKTRIGHRYGVGGAGSADAWYQGLFYGLQWWVFDDKLPQLGMEMYRAMEEMMHAPALVLPSALRRTA